MSLLYSEFISVESKISKLQETIYIPYVVDVRVLLLSIAITWITTTAHARPVFYSAIIFLLF